MAERHPGCLCFFRRSQKRGLGKGGSGGTHVAVEAAQRVGSEAGQPFAAALAQGDAQPRAAMCVSAAFGSGLASPAESAFATVTAAQLPVKSPQVPAVHAHGCAVSSTISLQPVLVGTAGPLQAMDSVCEPTRLSTLGLEARSARNSTFAAADAAPAATVSSTDAAPAAADAGPGAPPTAAAADTAEAATAPSGAAADAPNTDAATTSDAAAVYADHTAGGTVTDPATAIIVHAAAATATADDAADTNSAAVSTAADATTADDAAGAALSPQQQQQQEEAEPGGLSRSDSVGSTVYFSAGGWSQFGGEDGEWLGGSVAAFQLLLTEDVPKDAEAAAAPADGGDVVAAGVVPAAEAGPDTGPELAEDALGQRAADGEGCGLAIDYQQEQHQQDQHQQGQTKAQPHHLQSGVSPTPIGPFPASNRASPAAATPAEGSDSRSSPARRPPSLVPLLVHESGPLLGGGSALEHVPVMIVAQEPADLADRSEAPLPPLPHQHPQKSAGASSSVSDPAGRGVGGGAGAAGPPPQPQDATAPAAVPAPAAASGSSRVAVLDQVADLYGAQGRPCKACQVLLQFCKAHGVAPESVAGELRDRDLPDAATLTTVVRRVSECLTDLASDEGWQTVRNDELQLMYRPLPGGVHAFRARCVLDYPIEEPLALAREVDLCPTWNKYCTSAAVLREMSVTDVMVYMSLWVPWPFNNVGFLMEANGSDLYDEEGRLLVCFSSPSSGAKAPAPDAGTAATPSAPPSPPLPALPPGSEKHSRIRLLAPSCLSFRPVPPKQPHPPQVATGPRPGPGSGPGAAAHSSSPPHRTACEVQVYVDPGVRHVPPFIISFVLKVLSPFIYAAVKKVLASAFRSPTNPLPQRIQKRSELYGMIRRRTEAYLRSKAAASAADNGGEAVAAAAAAADNGGEAVAAAASAADDGGEAVAAAAGAATAGSGSRSRRG